MKKIIKSFKKVGLNFLRLIQLIIRVLSLVIGFLRAITLLPQSKIRGVLLAKRVRRKFGGFEDITHNKTPGYYRWIALLGFCWCILVIPNIIFSSIYWILRLADNFFDKRLLLFNTH